MSVCVCVCVCVCVRVCIQFTSEREWIERKDIMEILPETMRVSLALSLHEKMLSTVPLFFQTGHVFIAEVRHVYGERERERERESISLIIII